MPTSWTKDPSQRPSAKYRGRARAMRRNPTEAERRRWWHLRHHLPIENGHFRRQVPLGPYIADFCCMGAKLVIEVDGNQHGVDQVAVRDERRTVYLQAGGYRVLRFSNRDVMVSIDVVLDTIRAALGPTTPTPDPSPQGGGEA